MDKLIPTLQVLNSLNKDDHFITLTLFDGCIIIQRRNNSEEDYDAAQDALREADIRYVWRYNSIIVNPELL